MLENTCVVWHYIDVINVIIMMIKSLVKWVPHSLTIYCSVQTGKPETKLLPITASSLAVHSEYSLADRGKQVSHELP